MVSHFLRAHYRIRVEWVEYDLSEGNALALKSSWIYFYNNVFWNVLCLFFTASFLNVSLSVVIRLRKTLYKIVTTSYAVHAMIKRYCKCSHLSKMFPSLLIFLISWFFFSLQIVILKELRLTDGSFTEKQRIELNAVAGFYSLHWITKHWIIFKIKPE